MLSTSKNSNNSKKALALQALKERRLNGSTKSRTEEYEIADDGDLFDVVDEEEYTDIVQQRREREDFVVDDGTSHYFFIRLKCEVLFEFWILNLFLSTCHCMMRCDWFDDDCGCC